MTKFEAAVFGMTDDGIVFLDTPSWPAHIAITDQLLRHASRRVLTSGDGMVRFNVPCGALYGYAHPDDEYPNVNHYDLIREWP